jgi:hypothetical protein
MPASQPGARGCVVKLGHFSNLIGTNGPFSSGAVWRGEREG